MQLDKLQLDLRPRSNAQALDLGFALLRVDGRQVYAAFLALWIPVMGLAALLTLLDPDYVVLATLLAWWIRPLLERAPLFVLSRNVFGERVTWRQAIRAWPSLLGGGWFRLLTWWRPFLPNRGIYQPIWMLEGLRGKAASDRRRVIGRDSARAAYYFGIACAHFEFILQIGFVAFIGFFLTDENAMNPFAYLFSFEDEPSPLLNALVMLACYGVAVAIIAPIYTACCFTLYMNRRATLEAWDVELMLRQLPRTHHNRAAPDKAVSNKPASIKPTAMALWWLPFVVFFAFTSNEPAHADVLSAAEHAEQLPKAEQTTHATPILSCEKPDWVKTRQGTRAAPHNVQQQQQRAELDALFEHEDLRGYRCEELWVLKAEFAQKKKKGKKEKTDWSYLPLLADILKILLIAVAIGLLVWLIYRYRDQLVSLVSIKRRFVATEVSGLDIRPESLPDDITATVWQLWLDGEHRAAMALLYRATLSRLVNDFDIRVGLGATEQDCLHHAQRAHAQQRLSDACLSLITELTSHWLRGAYGARWLDGKQLEAMLPRWRQIFDQGREAEVLSS